MNIDTKIYAILKLLKAEYGAPPTLKRSDPIDELVRTILSQNTNDSNSLAAFAALKRRFKTWESLLGAKTAAVTRLIRHAGLANIKAGRIKEVLCRIKEGEGWEKKGKKGKISLAYLAKMTTGGALAYLKSLKGVGPKTAACVLLFSFGKPVMPVDTHIFRVTKRLGLIAKDLTAEEAHEVLTDMICDASSPEKTRDLIYEFHLCIIKHGRRTCRALNPQCGVCVLYGMCEFRDKKKYFRIQ